MKWKLQHEGQQPPKMNLTLRQGPQGNPFAGAGGEGWDICKMVVTRKEGTGEDGNAGTRPVLLLPSQQGGSPAPASSGCAAGSAQTSRSLISLTG